jgi:hypothetical protein
VGTWARGRRRPVWRDGETWLDPDEIQWFGEVARSVRAAVAPQPLLAGVDGGTVALPGVGLSARPSARAAPVYRRRPGPSRRRRLATRFLPSVTVLVTASAVGPALLAIEAAKPDPLPAAPPAPPALAVQPVSDSTPWLDLRAAGAAQAPPAEQSADAPSAQRPDKPAIAWRDSRAVGVPHNGRLVNGVRLPVAGPDWVTWDPVLHRVPNRATRLAGTDALVRLVLGVIGDYRLAHPKAPKVVVGDLSRVRGGEIDEHVSHENGLDVDVYYPRRDGKLRPPRTVSQVDVRLARDLLDRFVAAGASIVFVGWSTPLRGPAGVVVPYANHDNHMHVRIAPPA